jgi:hypothetical protein
MDRNRRRTLLLVAVCALAVLLTAATVASPTDGTTGVGGTDEGIGVDEGSGQPFGGGIGTANGGRMFSLAGVCDGGGPLPELLALFGLVVVGAGVVGYGRDGLSGAIGTVVVALLPIGLFLVFVLASCAKSESAAASDDGFLGGETSGGGSGIGDAVARLSTPEAVASILLIVAVGAALVVLIASRRAGEGDDEEEGWEVPERDPDREVEYDLGGVSAAAGAAADRLDGDADVTNEVYRAWREMTRHLRVDRPAASTPAEFADAAVEAGMDPEDVSELTEVFAAVRYGGEHPTDRRTRRAREALRRIERSYGGREP